MTQNSNDNPCADLIHTTFNNIKSLMGSEKHSISEKEIKNELYSMIDQYSRMSDDNSNNAMKNDNHSSGNGKINPFPKSTDEKDIKRVSDSLSCWMGNLNSRANDKIIMEFFKQHDIAVESVNIKAPKSPEHRGFYYAFINFESKSHAVAAEKLNNQISDLDWIAPGKKLQICIKN
eukprot:UN29642